MRVYTTLLSWKLCQVKQVMLQGFFLNSLFSTRAREVSSVCLTCEMGTDVEV